MFEEKVTAPISEPHAGKGFTFYLVLIWLILEYIRPQELIPGLGVLRLSLVVTALLGVTVLLSGRLRLTDRPTKLFILFLALMVPHVPLATNNYWALWTLYAMCALFCVYLAITTSFQSLSTIKTFVAMWLGIHVFLGIYGIRSGGTGVGGFLGDENDFALTLVMGIPYAYFTQYLTASKFKKLMLFGFIALLTLAAMMTFSRGGFLALSAVWVYCWLFSRNRIRSGIVIGLLIVVGVMFAPESYHERIRSIWEQGASEGTTGEDRLYQWKIGLRMFAGNPVFGVGQENFPWRFSEYEGTDTVQGKSRAGRAAHSLYFTLLPELGLVGTLIFAMMASCVARDLRLLARLSQARDSDDSDRQTLKLHAQGITRAMGGSFVAYFIGSAFISTLYYPHFWLLMAFVLALKKAYLAEIGDEEFEEVSAVSPVEQASTD